MAEGLRVRVAGSRREEQPRPANSPRLRFDVEVPAVGGQEVHSEQDEQTAERLRRPLEYLCHKP
jgi:hypothetical protein